MNASTIAARAHAPGPPSFELHTLGWRAFQDLCSVVLRDIWNQSAQAFADTNDGGRDGAFYGCWDNAKSVLKLPEVAFVMQCKFMAVPGLTLTPSSVEDELAKIGKLVSQGLCDTYILMTNARLTGDSERKIRAAIRAEGVETVRLLGGGWLNQTIAESQRLRMLVPRIYGLGDLSQILDERAYGQASALLDYLQEDLATFVPTDAYRNAARAVSEHGFCLLLGAPAVGKSVIAATLAMAALDNWGCLTIRADTPSDVVSHWNVNETNQFFWIDDAFGAVRHQQALTDDWERRMPKIMAAIKRGARIILTSRDYIYREARPSLKEYAYPLLREQQVVIDVAELTSRERRQIVYNHIRLGDQTKEFRSKLKPYLERFADQEPFLPEVVRRLGNSAFTQDMSPSRQVIEDFMARPNEFLADIYAGIEPSHKSALALVYQSGELPAPLDGASNETRELLSLIGGDLSSTANALKMLEGTFLRLAPRIGSSDGDQCWTFRHPTLREGFSAFIASDPNLLKLFIEGLDDNGILAQLDCGSGDQRGRLVVVPPSLYPGVTKRIGRMWSDLDSLPYDGRWRLEHSLLGFLSTRCSRNFLELYLECDPQLIDRSLKFGSYISAVPEPAILAQLHRFGLLPEEKRKELLTHVADLALETPDAGWLTEPSLLALISKEEREALLDRVRLELLPTIMETVEDWRFNEQGDSAEEYYRPLDEALRIYKKEFKERQKRRAVSKLARAITYACEMRDRATHWQDDYDDDFDTEAGRSQTTPLAGSLSGNDGEAVFASDRSVFDDVDE